MKNANIKTKLINYSVDRVCHFLLLLFHFSMYPFVMAVEEKSNFVFGFMASHGGGNVDT